MTKQTILVTGANGFVGEALLERLQHDAQFSIRAAVRRGNPVPMNGIEHTVVGDLAPDTDWSAALENVYAVVHLAARVHIMHDTVTDPLAAFRAVNVGGTLNLARQAAAVGVKRFVFASSVKVNGETTSGETKFAETDVPSPQDPYGISKWETEQALHRVAQETGLEIVIVRPPLVYGPRVKANFLNMMRWLHRGVPLPFGAINNRRSLVALDNLVDLIVTCLEHPAAANQTFLVSDGEDISTTELLHRMATALNVPARLLPVPHKLLEVGFKMVGKGDLAQRLCGFLQVDISKGCTMLGWKPLVSVDEALHRTAEYFLRERR